LESVTDASLAIRLPGQKQPLLGVDAIELAMEIQYESGIPVMKLASPNVFDHGQLTGQRSEESLGRIAPAMAGLQTCTETSLCLSTPCVFRCPVPGINYCAAPS
jgi:hypothetical protein